MTTSRIKEKISKIVASQLPEFIRADFTTFVSFIEAYYRFLEQDQGAYELIQNSRSYNDIDTTIESFIKYFILNYANVLPEGTLADKKLLVKKIKDLYESKGSNLSFKLLFKILFNEDVEVKYPYENVLRASAGKWQQNFSIRVETLTGNRAIIGDRILTYTFRGLTYETPITRIKNLTSTLTEVFLDNRFTPPDFDLNDVVYVYDQNNDVIFSGLVKPTTTDYEISQGGSGFKKGQIFTVNGFGGVGTLIKVSNTTSSGAVNEIKFINYGYNYNTDPQTFFTIAFSNTSSVSEVVNSFVSKTQGFTDTLTIVQSDPASPDRYFDTDYALDSFYTFTESLQTVSNTTATSAVVDTSGLAPNNFAVVTFRLGTLSKYQGSFYTNESFLSEADVRLQDDKLYQPFAYQTQTNIDVELFFDTVKKLIHPAGQELYNNRILSTDIDLSASEFIESASNVFFEAYDSVNILDPKTTTVFKNFEDDQNTIDSNDFVFNKNLEEQQPIPDVNFFELNKNIEIENFFIFDPASPDRYFLEDYVEVEPGDPYTFTSIDTIFTQFVTMTDEVTVGFFVTRVFDERRSNDYFLEVYTDEDYVEVTGIVLTDDTAIELSSSFVDTTSVIDQISIEVQKSTDESVFETESFISELNPQFNIDDSQTLQDIDSIELETTINNQTNTSDLTDVYLLDYSDTTYFSELYVGTTVI